MVKKWESFTNSELKGKRVKLIKMIDKYAVDPGSEGTIRGVDDIGNVLVNWDDGSTLSLIPGVDKYIIFDDIILENSQETFGQKTIREIKSQFNLQKNWKKISNSEINGSIDCWEYKIDNYSLLVTIRKSSDFVTCILYIKDENGDIHYVDSVENPYTFKRFFNDWNYNKYVDFAINAGKEQLKYFKLLEKMPTDDELRGEILVDITDEDCIIDAINYGYINRVKLLEDDDTSDMCLFHKDMSNSLFVCVIELKDGITRPDKFKEFEKVVGFMKGKLSVYGDYEVDWSYGDSIPIILVIIPKKQYTI